MSTVAPTMPAGLAPSGARPVTTAVVGRAAGSGLGHPRGDRLIVGQPHHIARRELRQVADLGPGDDRKLLAAAGAADLARGLVDRQNGGGRLQDGLALGGLFRRGASGRRNLPLPAPQLQPSRRQIAGAW